MLTELNNIKQSVNILGALLTYGTALGNALNRDSPQIGSSKAMTLEEFGLFALNKNPAGKSALFYLIKKMALRRRRRRCSSSRGGSRAWGRRRGSGRWPSTATLGGSFET